jgi:microcystin-dependent protein
MDYWLPTAPNSAFVFPIGQAISRTVYATLFAAMGTTFGTGDGSTTFNLPDKRGRASVAADSSASRISTTTMNSVTLGGTGGGETNTLGVLQLPTGITSSGTNSISVTTAQKVVNGPNAGSAQAGGTQVTAADTGSGGALSLVSSTGSNSISVTSNNTGGLAHANMQPSIVCNYILRII